MTQEELYGIGVALTGVFLLVVAIRYFSGVGMQHTPVGTPAAGVGLGPSFMALGTIFLLSSLPSDGLVALLDHLLLGIFFVGGGAGFIILSAKPLFGWPRYGQYPVLKRHRRESPAHNASRSAPPQR
jgi:hypothetical protein